jgi:DinB superfamily
MTAPGDLASAIADHGAAVEEAAGAIVSVEPSRWSVAPGPGKWCAAEIAQHLILSYGPLSDELSGGKGFALRVRPRWLRALVRWRYLPGILRTGRFPAGARAPREARPEGPLPARDDAVRRLREAARRFERRLAEAAAASRVRLTHAYFGALTATQAARFLAMHARHHAKQLPPPGSG